MKFNLEQIQDVWSHSLTAETIAEPIMVISCSDDMSKAIELKAEKRFDILGLKNDSDRVVGYIEVNDSLEGLCEEHCQTFDIESLVSTQTPLKDCMSHIANKKRLFVLGNNGVEGIITLADLHKQPVRMLLFSMVSLLDMTMSKLIKIHYPNDSWCDELTEGRLIKAQELYDERKKKGQEIDIGDCLQLCDKSCILLKTDIREAWKFESKAKAKDFFKDITTLRDNLAHSQENICSDIPTVISLCNIAEDLIETSINIIGRCLEESC